MTTETKPQRVGLIGASPSTSFVQERLTLRRDFQAVALWLDDSSAQPDFIDDGCTRHSQPQEIINDPSVDLVYFANAIEATLVSEAIRAGKPVVIESPVRLSADEMKQLAAFAERHSVLATVHEASCWDSEFLVVKSAVESGRLGDIRRLRLSIHEHGLPEETFARGVVRDLGCRWFMQLLQLVGSAPKRLDLRRFHQPNGSAEEGFLAMIEFDGGASALLEIQTRSLLSYRPGWILEGTTGAVRAGRIFSQTADGEIIDEPLPKPIASNDPFLDSLALALCGKEHFLPSLREASRVVSLIDGLEASRR